MPRKILIVDDNVINRRLLKKTLHKDYDILEAENGREAFDMICRHYKMLSAVLLDIVMPEMDGYEVLRKVRENVLLAQLPIIMVTGSEDEESRVKALSFGANDFILKPFNPEIVKHCLKNNIALRETASILNAIQKDKLTGLYNREAFFEKVTGMVADRAPGYYILSCFDIDNFKLINDQYGAAEGDRILREIGRVVSEDMEVAHGVAGRISADNFAVLLPVENKELSITRIVQQNRMAFSDKQAIVFSVGRYIVSDPTLPASALYDRAYIAKQSVKGRYDKHIAYFDDTMLERLVRDQQIIADVDAAIAEHQFEIWFQPQCNHSTGALVGAEALVRWRHPEKGLIYPGDFIPVFEQSGFVYELDKYVWEETCRHLRRWIDEGRNPLPVSVNVSRYDIFRTDFIDVLARLIQKYGIPVELLKLEITESAFAKSTSTIVHIVRELTNRGFTIEIDDFGSGYSSLNVLKSVPAQVVKLDMRFLEDDDGSGRSGNIIESIVRMTKWLGMSVIAEGVEDREQADYLASIGCSYIQGYLYARPMPAPDYEHYCRHAGKEERLLSMETVANLDNNSFWSPKSMDTLIFNSYVGAACIFEYHNRSIELLRVNTKFTAILGDGTMSVEDTLSLDWISCLTPESLNLVRDVLRLSSETGDEYTREYVFVNIPGGPPKTYLRATMRVIATAEQRLLVYCTSENVTAQRQAEESARKAERENAAVAGQLQAVMDNVGCGITAITYEADAVNYLMINDRYYALLGYTKEQYERIETFSPIYASDRTRVIEASRQVYESGKPATIEYRAVKRDGNIIWMRVSMTMTRFAGIDKPVQLSIFSDITAERQAARELLDNLPGGAALYEYNGKDFYAVHINKRYWELVDRAPVNYDVLSVTDSLHPEDVALIEREVASAISQKRDAACDIRIRYGTDGYRPFHIVGRIVPAASGRYSIYASYTPISDEAMSLQKMLPVALQAVMDSSSEISFVKGTDLRYICCSLKFARLTGRSSENELLGKTSFDVFSPELARQHDAVDRAILKDGESYVDIDILFPAENGIRRLLFSKYPLLDAKGNVLGVYGTGHDVTEVREVKSRLELLTNNIPGGIAVYEGRPEALDQIRLTYFSDGLCRLFGYTRTEYEQLTAVNPLGLVFPADVSKMRENILALVQNGVPLDYVYRARMNGGATKWINGKAVMGEPNGDSLTVNAVFFDVTEQRIALEKLRVSEEVNRLAIQLSRNVVGQYNVAKRELVLSPNADPIFNPLAVEDDVPYRAVREKKISPETTGAYTAFFESILHGEKTGEVLYQIKSTLGWRWIEAHFCTIFSDGGKPDTAVISFDDVTESLEKDAAYKKWKQSLRDRQPESYSLYHCNVTKDAVLDSTEGLLIPHEITASLSHLSERTASYVEQCVFSEDRERFLSIMDREIQLLRYSQSRRTDTLEYRERLKEDSVRWLRLTVDLVDAPYSSDVEAYLLFENIDEAKRMELEIIERAETDPLTGVYNRTTFVQKVDELISESKPDARHALLMLDIDGFKLVNDAFGHGAGDQVLIDIAESLHKGSRRDDLIGRLGGDEFVVFLSNISDDAAAARKAQQTCELTRKTFSVEVQVSGSVGIALYPQDGRSFQALYKKADDTLYYVKGMGKNNYAFYRGDMAERSVLPQRAADRAPAFTHPAAKRRMLIVDDSKTDCELLANMFKDEFQVEKALDGGSALIKLRHYGSAVSIVLLDLLMPGLDGFAVLEQMRQSADLQSVPVIVVSGLEDYETSLAAIKAGAADFVTKPVDPDLLRVRIQSAVSKAENERLRAQNSYLELRGSEASGYRTVLEKTGTLVIMHDWGTGSFTYSPSISSYLAGRYDKRPLWHILMSDMVADARTVKDMQQLVHSVANDRGCTDGSMTVRLKSASGEKRLYNMNVYKQANEYGLTDKLVLTFQEASVCHDETPDRPPEETRNLT